MFFDLADGVIVTTVFDRDCAADRRESDIFVNSDLAGVEAERDCRVEDALAGLGRSALAVLTTSTVRFTRRAGTALLLCCVGCEGVC